MKKIPLTQGKFTLVDDDDYDYLSQWKWYATLIDGTFYAERNGKLGEPTKIKMHRVILGTEKGFLVDHRDGDGLNNRKDNIRSCTHTENARNRRLQYNSFSGYKGVSWHKKSKKWRSRITVDGKLIRLGSFFCLIKAAKAYDKAAKKYHGKFANINFPTATECKLNNGETP